ncbi:divalent metal cation transporter [Mesorhizobium sophorae]|uniref:divalent metal cation transporter n=1 Tax=Mesorhizobium sophorae TaxID=1300294 RepID=UPI001FD9BE6A|nr:divalent metal cation transporter [Mesorhizobium sophorae]
MATAAQAGATFGFRLIWAILLGTICIIFLVEMAGRFAAVSGHTISDGIRERFGFNAFLWPLLATLLVNLMVMSAEIGGVAIAAELATGIGFQWWALPLAFLAWLFLKKGSRRITQKMLARTASI